MQSPDKTLLLAALAAASLWTFSEVVLGSALRVFFLPIRGIVLAGIASGILFAAYSLDKRLHTVILTISIAIPARILFASSFDSGVSITNGSLAVLIQGLLLTAAVTFIHAKKILQPTRLGILAGSAMLLAGIFFYAIGMHVDPCPWLASQSFLYFIVQEAVPWAVFAGIMAPIGFHVGGVVMQPRLYLTPKPLSVIIMMTCWISCALVEWLN